MTSPAVVATPGALSLGALLLRTTRLTPEQLDDARARAEDAGTSLVDVLIENGMLEEPEILGALGEALGMPVRSPIAGVIELSMRLPGAMMLAGVPMSPVRFVVPGFLLKSPISLLRRKPVPGTTTNDPKPPSRV